MLPEEAIRSIRKTVSWIVDKQWDELRAAGACERVTPAEIERALFEYGVELVEHPVDQFQSSMEIYPTHEDGI